MDALASTEHRRWIAERTLAGWRQAKEGEKRIDSLKIHTCITSHSKLPKDELIKDRNVVEFAPVLVEFVEGTPLYCLGNLLSYSGMFVCRKYNSTLEDIQNALMQDHDVVVGVDREKLYAEAFDLEDLTNHAVVVTHIEDHFVTVFDPYEEPYISRIPLNNFLNAWKESNNYMIQVLQSVEEYEPHPINVDDIPLDGDLEELQEAIAENAHDVWAEARIKEGWTYGKERDDANKRHPDLVPYTALPENEKEYDRIMAFNTIKLVKKLGFDIVKRNYQ